ncbi:hypothetical protein CSB20_07735 [bacterium DOLZORAL124_64_63]|nr:MAG: hypothetical protein CSB20_07735 [bacterium DOLZORAL124_64_63]
MGTMAIREAALHQHGMQGTGPPQRQSQQIGGVRLLGIDAQGGQRLQTRQAFARQFHARLTGACPQSTHRHSRAPGEPQQQIVDQVRPQAGILRIPDGRQDLCPQTRQQPGLMLPDMAQHGAQPAARLDLLVHLPQSHQPPQALGNDGHFSKAAVLAPQGGLDQIQHPSLLPGFQLPAEKREGHRQLVAPGRLSRPGQGHRRVFQAGHRLMQCLRAEGQVFFQDPAVRLLLFVLLRVPHTHLAAQNFESQVHRIGVLAQIHRHPGVPDQTQQFPGIGFQIQESDQPLPDVLQLLPRDRRARPCRLGLQGQRQGRFQIGQ